MATKTLKIQKFFVTRTTLLIANLCSMTIELSSMSIMLECVIAMKQGAVIVKIAQEKCNITMW